MVDIFGIEALSIEVSCTSDDMILHILKNLPKEFETVVEICEEVLPRRENSLTTVKKCVSDYRITD